MPGDLLQLAPADQLERLVSLMALSPEQTQAHLSRTGATVHNELTGARCSDADAVLVLLTSEEIRALEPCPHCNWKDLSVVLGQAGGKWLRARQAIKYFEELERELGDVLTLADAKGLLSRIDSARIRRSSVTLDAVLDAALDRLVERLLERVSAALDDQLRDEVVTSALEPLSTVAHVTGELEQLAACEQLARSLPASLARPGWVLARVQHDSRALPPLLRERLRLTSLLPGQLLCLLDRTHLAHLSLTPGLLLERSELMEQPPTPAVLEAFKALCTPGSELDLDQLLAAARLL